MIAFIEKCCLCPPTGKEEPDSFWTIQIRSKYADMVYILAIHKVCYSYCVPSYQKKSIRIICFTLNLKFCTLCSNGWRTVNTFVISGEENIFPFPFNVKLEFKKTGAKYTCSTSQMGSFHFITIKFHQIFIVAYQQRVLAVRVWLQTMLN